MSRQVSLGIIGGMEMDDSRSVIGEQVNVADKVVINVGGQKHETYITTLKNIPDTRLYWITENRTQLPEFDPNTSEFFFDRHPGVFAQILNFYRTGKLHCPNDVCGPLFEDELAFWGIDELQVEPCCWLNYKQHREAQANLDPFESRRDSDGESVSDMDMSVYGLVADSIRNRNRPRWKKYQAKIWTMFEEPYSSIPAQVVAFITLFFIIVSVIIFCLETVPYFSDQNTIQSNALYVMETICVAWFTLEFITRLVCCPKKLGFFKKPMNWIDLGAIIPFFLQISLNRSNIKTIVVLRVVRLIRVFRIFKLSRHSYGLQILGHTLKSSCSELFLLVFFLSIGVIIFSSIMYYAEKDHQGTYFTTIPHGFWWAVVTMTTLGYGDMVPITWQGKIVGSFCAVCGVLMIALPVPVIVSNFSLYYSHAKARMKLPRRKRPTIFGAASALRVTQPFASNEHNPNVVTQLIEEGIRNNDDGSDDSNFVSMRTPRNSSRRSPRHSINSNYSRARTPVPRNVFASSPMINSPCPSPRSSFASHEQKTKDNLAVPTIQKVEIELKERSSNQVTSDVPERDQETALTSSSSENSPSPDEQPCQMKSTLSDKHSDTEGISTSSEVKSPKDKIKTLPGKSLSSDSATGSPRGRRGRRGSLYIVGFTAKHWQNKALNKTRKKRQSSEDITSKDLNKYQSKENGSVTGADHQSSPTNGCDTRNQQATAQSISVEVLTRPGNERTNDNIETSFSACNSGREVRNENNDDLHHNKHTYLLRVSSSTQTDDTTENVEELDDKIRDNTDTRARQTLMSVKSIDSTSKLSDDSLTVQGPLRQRRGSSPLIRQRAVFTFDMADHPIQIDPSASSIEPSQKRNLSTSKVGDEAASPSLPSFIEHPPNGNGHQNGRRSSGGNRKKNLNTPSPTEEKSGRKSKVRPKSLPSSYINQSYQKEEEDSLSKIADERGSPKMAQSRTQAVYEGKKSFQPYKKLGSAAVTETQISSEKDLILQDQNTEASFTDRGTRTQPSPPPIKSLPSITEEQPSGTSAHAPGLFTLPRPHSLPSDVFDRPVNTAWPFNHALSFPLSEMHNMNDLPYQGFQGEQRGDNFLHPTYNGRQPNHAADYEPLLQRRRGPLLYLHVSPEDSFYEQHRERQSSLDYRTPADGTPRYHSNLTASGGFYVTTSNGVFTSAPGSGFTSASGSGFTSAPGSGYVSAPGSSLTPGSDGRFTYPAYLPFSSSPASLAASASRAQTQTTRDFATSPLHFDDNTVSFLPFSSTSSTTAGQYVERTVDGTFLNPHHAVHPNRARSWSAPEETTRLASEKARSRARSSLEYELVPISHAQDQSGQQYSVYAVPTSLQGMVIYSSEPASDKSLSGEDGDRETPNGVWRIQEGFDQETTVNASREAEIKLESNTAVDYKHFASVDSYNRVYQAASSIVDRRASRSNGFKRNSNKYDTELNYRTIEDNGQGGHNSVKVEDTCKSHSSSNISSDEHSLNSTATQSDSNQDDLNSEENNNENSDIFKSQGLNSQPKLQRSDKHVVYNGHESLQQKLSDSLQVAKRPTSVFSPDRRRARAMFFGDSGISSVESGSMASISHSIESEVEIKERSESVTSSNTLNPIRETEVENPGTLRVLQDVNSISCGTGNGKVSVTDSMNNMTSSVKERDNHVINIDLYESSAV